MILTGISKTNTIEYLWKKHCSEHFPKVKLDDDIFIDLQADDTFMAGVISTYLKTQNLTTQHKEIAQNILANFHKYDSALYQLPSNIKYFKRSICLLNLILDKETDLRDILLFDGVKIVEIDKTQLKDKFILNSVNKDIPKVGDIATIVEVYEYKDIGLGIELECFNNNTNGIPIWLNAFPISAIRIEPVER